MTVHSRVHFINFARKLTVSSVLFLAPMHFLALGFDGWRIGALISFYALAPLFVAFPTGWTNDRFSIAGVVRAGLALEAALLFLAAWTRSFPAFAAVFLGLGIANNALDISLNSLFYKDETAIDQNRKYAVYVFWNAVGPAVGVLGGGYLAQIADFRTVFLVFGAITVVVVFAARNFDGARFHAVPLREYIQALARRKTLLFIVFLFILALHWAVEGTVYSPFLKDAFGLDGFQASLYMSAGLFAMSFAAFLIGFKKFEARANARLLLFFMALSGVGLILMTVQNVYLSLGFRILHDIADGGLGALITVAISRLFEKRNIGGSAGLVVSIMIFGQMAGAMFFSPLGYRFGLRYPFLIAGGLLIVNAVYGAWLFRNREY
jgi:MFS family permease